MNNGIASSFDPGFQAEGPAPQHDTPILLQQKPWAEREWDPSAALATLAAAWRLLALSVLLCLTIAWLVLEAWPRRYTAETLVLLDPRNQPNLQLDEVLAGIAPDDQTISSEVLVLKSSALAAQVIADLELANDPAFNPALLPESEAWKVLLPENILQRLGGSSDTSSLTAPEAALEALEIRIIQAFAERLEVEREGRSHAIRIGFTATTPEQAADVANRLAARYLEGQLSVKFEAHGAAQDWLNTRVAELQENVEAAERAVEDYRNQSGLIDSNGVTVTTQQMGEINTRLIAARAETAAAEARLAQVKDLVGRNGGALSAAEVLSSPLIHRLKEQEVEVLRRRADLSQEFGPRHPKMLSVKAELADIRGRIMAEVRQIVAGLKNEVAVAAAQEQALAGDLERLSGETAAQNHAEVRLRALEREAEASRNLLETFLARMKETSNQEDIQRSDARILSPALPPVKPSSPRVLLVMVAAALLGLLLASGWVLFRSVQRHAAGDLSTFRERTGLRVLACVPKAAWHAGGRQAKVDLAVGLDHASRLTAAGLGQVPAMMVAPVEPGTNSAAVAIALAKTLARDDREVLLVDAETHGAGLSTQLGMQSASGFADAMSHDDLGPVMAAPSGVEGSRILPAGQGDLRSLLPMAASTIDARWDRLHASYPQVVMHCGPALGAVETRLFARCCGAVVFVVRWGRTPLQSVREAASLIWESGGRVGGVILLDVDSELATASTYLGGSPPPPIPLGKHFSRAGI